MISISQVPAALVSQPVATPFQNMIVPDAVPETAWLFGDGTPMLFGDDTEVLYA